MTGDVRRPAHRGQALAEVMLVLPLLLLLALGTVDIGRLLFASVALEEAVQEGALFAAYNPTPTGPIQDRVRASSNATEVQAATVSVTCTASPAPGTVSVTAAVDYALITPVISSMLGDTVRLTATVVAPNIQAACS